MRLGRAVLGSMTIAVALALAAAIAAPAAPAPAGQAGAERPALLVLLVVDQFRGDYVQRYGHQWTSGLRRLIDQGAYFPRAAYTFAGTKTCAGHVTIGTGMVPSTHGMIDNAWYDRAAGRSIACTTTDDVTSVPFGGAEGDERHGPGQLLVPTLADELRLQSAVPVRVVSMALKARSAIGLAGHAGPGVMPIWTESGAVFATSSAYTSTPWPEIDRYLRAHPIAATTDSAWTRLLPPDAYLFDDDAPGEDRDSTFPHPLRDPENPEAFAWRWEASPLSDAYLADMAAALVQELELGGRGGTDLLAIGFSALDLIGHSYGPRSHEVQDTLARLDRALGGLLDALDASVGRGRYVVALSADHGISPLPEQATAMGIAAGRLSSTSLRRAVDAALEPALGAGRHVANVTSPFLYFTSDAAERIRTDPPLRRTVTDALLAEAGVWQVYWADEIAAHAATDDPVLIRLRRSYVADRSGDVAFVVKPYWVPQSSGTTHGSPHAYDRSVPIMLYGTGIAPGRYLDEAAPEDIAPTLALLAGITLARTDGQVLTSALVRRP